MRFSSYSHLTSKGCFCRPVPNQIKSTFTSILFQSKYLQTLLPPSIHNFLSVFGIFTLLLVDSLLKTKKQHYAKLLFLSLIFKITDAMNGFLGRLRLRGLRFVQWKSWLVFRIVFLLEGRWSPM